jgi:hypothetical protein
MRYQESDTLKIRLRHYLWLLSIQELGGGIASAAIVKYPQKIEPPVAVYFM